MVRSGEGSGVKGGEGRWPKLHEILKKKKTLKKKSIKFSRKKLQQWNRNVGKEILWKDTFNIFTLILGDGNFYKLKDQKYSKNFIWRIISTSDINFEEKRRYWERKIDIPILSNFSLIGNLWIGSWILTNIAQWSACLLWKGLCIWGNRMYMEHCDILSILLCSKR